jgi:O-antigen ligase
MLGARIADLSATVFLMVVALAPLPFGSANPTIIAVWCVSLGVAIICAPVGQLRRPHLALLGIAAAFIAFYALVLHEQVASQAWFPGVLPHPIWQQASGALASPIEPSASIARNEPLLALGSPLVCMLALICGFLFGGDAGRARRLLWVIAWSGVAYAVYGIAAQLIDPTKVLWRVKPAYVANVTSTFINRNTAAVYFGSCAIVCLALICDSIHRTLPNRLVQWRGLINRVMADPRRRVVGLLAMQFVCLTAMFMTSSRAGVILSLFAMVLAFAAYFYRKVSGGRGIAAVALGGVVAVLGLLQFLGDQVNARFDAQGASDEGRFATYRATLRMIADHPWLGTGQGTFQWAYPAYRSDAISMWGTWDRAHNSLLEIASDTGLPLAILVALGWLTMFGVLLHGVRVRRRDLLLPVSALSVGVLAVSHSLIDFSLQVPGYAIPAFALVGAGLAQSFASRQRTTASFSKEEVERAVLGLAAHVKK